MDNIDIQRAEHAILELLCEFFIKGKIRDPRISSDISFIRVKLAKDMSSAIVWVSCYIDQSGIEEAVEALNAASWKIQSFISKRLPRKRTPKLKFKVDTSISTGDDVLNNLDRLR